MNWNGSKAAINTDKMKSEIAEFLNLKLNNDLITQNIIPIPEAINQVTALAPNVKMNVQPKPPSRQDLNQTLRIHKTSSNPSSTQLTQPNHISHTDRNSVKEDANNAHIT